MRILMVVLTGIVFISSGCVKSSFITQDNYLAHQGYVELSKGNYSLAEANLLVSLDIKPDNPYALLNLGAVYQNTGRSWQAAGIYRKLIELEPAHRAVQSNIEDYAGKSLVEIAKENLRILKSNGSEKVTIPGSFDAKEKGLTLFDAKTGPIPPEDHLTDLNGAKVICATALHAADERGPVVSKYGDGPSAVGITGNGASGDSLGGDPAGGSGAGDGGGDGGDAGDGGGGGDGGDAGDASGDGGGSGDGGSDGGGSGIGGGDDGGSGIGGGDDGGTGNSGGDGDGISGGNSNGNGNGHGGGNNGGHGGGNSGGNSGGNGNGHGGGIGGGNSGGHGNGHGGGNGSGK